MSSRKKSKPINPIRAAFLEAVQMIEEGGNAVVLKTWPVRREVLPNRQP
jgi:hypothetical protein